MSKKNVSPTKRMRADQLARTIVFGRLVRESDLVMPGRIQLIRELARHSNVVFLEAPRIARTGWWDTCRPTLEKVAEKTYIARDALALRNHRAGRRLSILSAAFDGRWLEDVLDASGLVPYLYWLQSPDLSMARGLRRGLRIFDCMDPNFLPEAQHKFEYHERRLASSSRLVIASADTLHRRMLTLNPESFLVKNASPLPDFGTAPLETIGGRPLKGPVVGYLGTVDWRFDCEAIASAAKRCSDALFVIAGRVNSDQQLRTQILRDLPNVVFTGSVAAEDGDALVAAFDVGVIPFLPGDMGDAIDPVKMYMYLGHGKPVVSTDLAECRANPWVVSTSRPADFAEAVAAALTTEDANSSARKEFAANNTWSARADEVIRILRDHDLWGRS